METEFVTDAGRQLLKKFGKGRYRNIFDLTLVSSLLFLLTREIWYL